MNRRRILPLLALTALLAGPAMAQQAPSGTGLEGYGGPHGGPGGPPPDGFDHHHGGPDPFANTPKPLTADSTREALEMMYSRRPHVGRVTEKDPSTLEVEVIMPDGRSQTMLVDKQTGARQPFR